MKTSVAVGSTVGVDSGEGVTPGEQPITDIPIMKITIISAGKRGNVLKALNTISPASLAKESTRSGLASHFDLYHAIFSLALLNWVKTIRD